MIHVQKLLKNLLKPN